MLPETTVGTRTKAGTHRSLVYQFIVGSGAGDGSLEVISRR
jgi:hypothetical protein